MRGLVEPLATLAQPLGPPERQETVDSRAWNNL